MRNDCHIFQRSYLKKLERVIGGWRDVSLPILEDSVSFS